MKLTPFNYADSKSADELVIRCMQNTVIKVVTQERIISTLDKLKIVHHSTLYRALKKRSSLKQVSHVFSRIQYYFAKREQDPVIFYNVFKSESDSALTQNATLVIEQACHVR